MLEDEILRLWKSGLSKDKLALIYKRRNNQIIKMIRLDMHNRHSGKFISNYEALAIVEKVIYEYLKNIKSR